MSIAAPTQIAFTGGATINISVTWSVNTAGSTMSIDSVTYSLNDVFGKQVAILNGLMNSVPCSAYYAQQILWSLQRIVKAYDLQDGQTQGLPLSIAIT